MPVGPVNYRKPDMQARFESPQEFQRFLEHYRLTFPFHLRVWHGKRCSAWLVAPEQSSLAPPVNAAAGAVTTGATTPTYAELSDTNVTQPAEP